MNPLSACKETLKEMKSLLGTHPDNNWLKKWARRLSNAIKETKTEGYSKEFELFWAAYFYTNGTSKQAAYGNWCQIDEELHGQVILAAGMYAKDIKGGDTKPCHPTVWLNQKRWESYEVSEKVKAKKMCPFCKTGEIHDWISIKELRYGRYSNSSIRVCLECKKYNGMKLEDIRKDIKKGGE